MTAEPTKTATKSRRDSQQVELLGRNRLIDELLRDGLEVALPLRDRGIDLIVYADLESTTKHYPARPIQMKAASTRSFLIEKKYAKFPGLLLAFVWYLDDPAQAVTYTMNYGEAVAIGDALGWTTNGISWERDEKYTSTRPSRKLTALLEPYRMTQGRWWEKVVAQTIVPDASAL